MRKYMGLQIDPEKLISKQILLERLASDGANYQALSALRDEQAGVFGEDLAWHYPISDGNSLGAYIFRVKEGFLWVPYDEVDLREGELLNVKGAALLTKAGCQILAEDWKSYADALHSALVEMGNACANALEKKSSG